MNNFKFIRYPDPENEKFDKSTITFDLNAERLPEILLEFESFLRACGFEVPYESLIIDKD